MSRRIYALIVDCTEDSVFVPALLAQVQEVIAQRGWPEVRAHWVSIDEPLAADDRQQDPGRTTPEIRMVDTG
jgi:hypothetical protein